MINKIFKDKFDPKISIKVPENNFELDDNKRADVLLSVMNSIRQNILSWTEQSYKVTSWSVGILLSVLSFWILYGDPNNLKNRFIIAAGVLIFGSFTQLYLLAALRAFRGNGDALIKCEAALKLCDVGSYFKDKPFFGYSGKWFSSKSLSVLRLFHVSVLIFAFISIIFISPTGKTLASSSEQVKSEKQHETIPHPPIKTVNDNSVEKNNIPPWVSSIDIGSSVTAMATVVLAILTAIYVILTRKILRAQVEPCVILTVVHDEKRPSVLQLVVENIGNGVAHDIMFEFSRNIPMKAWGLTVNDAKEIKHMDSGPLINGIPALGPGDKRKIDWGQYGGLSKYIGDDPIVVTCKFKSRGKYLKPVICKLDVKSFEGTTAADTEYLKHVSTELKRIADNIDQLATGFKTLKVEFIDKKQPEKEV